MGKFCKMFELGLGTVSKMFELGLGTISKMFELGLAKLVKTSARCLGSAISLYFTKVSSVSGNQNSRFILVS